MYTVSTYDEAIEVPTRKKAVERARSMSRATRGRVIVTGTEEPVRMVYRDGSVMEYELRTGRRRR